MRSRKPNALHSQRVALLTSAYASVGMTDDRGMERFVITPASLFSRLEAQF